MAGRPKIEVAASRSYPVFSGVKLEELGEYLLTRLQPEDHLLVISQPAVVDRHFARLAEGLRPFKVDLITFPASEEEKSLERLAQIASEAVRLGADRGTVVVAFGGGVVGDLAGFFASVYMRGIPFVQVPTTLLAQVDSSIGGKVGINHPAAKNLLGAFHPPLAVWSDFTTTATLPWQEVQNGLAETVKHAILGDSELFDFLEQHVAQVQEREPTVWRGMIERSLAVKVRIVSQDEHEHGKRALLNLGHSFGHALETELGYHGLAHGQGVSIGIVAASRLAAARGWLNREQCERIVRLLQAFDLPVAIKDVDIVRLMSHMQADKKNRSGCKVLILPRGIGQAEVVDDCTDGEIEQAWRQVVLF